MFSLCLSTTGLFVKAAWEFIFIHLKKFYGKVMFICPLPTGSVSTLYDGAISELPDTYFPSHIWLTAPRSV